MASATPFFSRTRWQTPSPREPRNLHHMPHPPAPACAAPAALREHQPDPPAPPRGNERQRNRRSLPHTQIHRLLREAQQPQTPPAIPQPAIPSHPYTSSPTRKPATPSPTSTTPARSIQNRRRGCFACPIPRSNLRIGYAAGLIERHLPHPRPRPPSPSSENLSCTLQEPPHAYSKNSSRLSQSSATKLKNILIGKFSSHKTTPITTNHHQSTTFRHRKTTKITQISRNPPKNHRKNYRPHAAEPPAAPAARHQNTSPVKS